MVHKMANGNPLCEQFLITGQILAAAAALLICGAGCGSKTANTPAATPVQRVQQTQQIQQAIQNSTAMTQQQKDSAQWTIAHPPNEAPQGK